ncbi:MAG: alpha/beta hydrolase [Clostridiales bacterium]|nr:alpha/beta hydrolase [Clostridiales bacterium]
MGLQDMWLKKADNERSEFINKCIEWDTPRLANEVCPEGVTVLQDIIYDETKGEYGLLDIYFPGTQQEGFDEAFFLIHGGAFVYGSKELDKNYGMHLALKSGLPVINVNYTLMPDTDLAGEAEELCLALAFLHDRYGLAKVHTTGDSAGAYLALLTVFLCNDPKVRTDLKIECDPKVECLSAGLICGGFIRRKREFPGIYMDKNGSMPEYLFDMGKATTLSFGRTHNIPLSVITGDNDTMLGECRCFKKALDKAKIPVDYYEAASAEDRMMFHVFPIAAPDWPESEKVIGMFCKNAGR